MVFSAEKDPIVCMSSLSMRIPVMLSTPQIQKIWDQVVLNRVIHNHGQIFI